MMSLRNSHPIPAHSIAGSYIRALRCSAERIKELEKFADDDPGADALANCVRELEREANKLEMREMLLLPWLRFVP